jgi:hypothetical protein
MTLLKLFATSMSLAIAGLGILGIAAPGVLLDFGRSLMATPALYGVAAVRIGFGALLMLVAAQSRFPRVLRMVGLLIVVAGFLTLWFGAERFHGAFGWFADLPTALVRAIAILPLLAGVFFVYAINSQRHGVD